MTMYKVKNKLNVWPKKQQRNSCEMGSLNEEFLFLQMANDSTNLLDMLFLKSVPFILTILNRRSHDAFEWKMDKMPSMHLLSRWKVLSPSWLSTFAILNQYESMDLFFPTSRSLACHNLNCLFSLSMFSSKLRHMAISVM